MLNEEIQKDLIRAMKAKDATTVSTLRMLTSAIMYYKLEKGEDRRDVKDEDVVNVVQREIKKRRESVELYRKGGREEQAVKEEEEIIVLKKYLPEQMSEEEVRKIVRETISQTGASGQSDMGKVMGALMPKTKGKADGAMVSRIVREELQ